MANKEKEEKVTWANVQFGQKLRFKRVWVFFVSYFLYATILVAMELYDSSLMEPWLTLTKPVTDIFWAQNHSYNVQMLDLNDHIHALAFIESILFVLVYLKMTNTYYRKKFIHIYKNNYKVKVPLILTICIITIISSLYIYLQSYFSGCILDGARHSYDCNTLLGPFFFIFPFLLFAFAFLCTLSTCIQFVRVRVGAIFGRSKDVT
jgi:fumarate reductase subunit C